jgi:hypothetical protein
VKIKKDYLVDLAVPGGFKPAPLSPTFSPTMSPTRGGRFTPPSPTTTSPTLLHGGGGGAYTTALPAPPSSPPPPSLLKPALVVRLTDTLDCLLVGVSDADGRLLVACLNKHSSMYGTIGFAQPGPFSSNLLGLSVDRMSKYTPTKGVAYCKISTAVGRLLTRCFDRLEDCPIVEVTSTELVESPAHTCEQLALSSDARVLRRRDDKGFRDVTTSTFVSALFSDGYRRDTVGSPAVSQFTPSTPATSQGTPKISTAPKVFVLSSTLDIPAVVACGGWNDGFSGPHVSPVTSTGAPSTAPIRLAMPVVASGGWTFDKLLASAQSTTTEAVFNMGAAVVLPSVVVERRTGTSAAKEVRTLQEGASAAAADEMHILVVLVAAGKPWQLRGSMGDASREFGPALQALADSVFASGSGRPGDVVGLDRRMLVAAATGLQKPPAGMAPLVAAAVTAVSGRAACLDKTALELAFGTLGQLSQRATRVGIAAKVTYHCDAPGAARDSDLLKVAAVAARMSRLVLYSTA